MTIISEAYDAISSKNCYISWKVHSCQIREKKMLPQLQEKPLAVFCLHTSCPVPIKVVCRNDPNPWSSPLPVFTWGCCVHAQRLPRQLILQQQRHLLSSLEWDIALPCHSPVCVRIRCGFQKEIVCSQSL